MPETVIAECKTRPEFDLEDFMNFAHETRIANEALQHLLSLWESWSSCLRAREIKADAESWLAIWLPEEIEREVDEIWDKSPGEGFLLNSLAQYLCMSAVNDLLPEIGDGGCAPAPKPHPALAGALEDIGLGQMGPAMTRRYAILTYFPFRGGCEICSMQEDCPRNLGEPSFATVTLPGHERGKDD